MQMPSLRRSVVLVHLVLLTATTAVWAAESGPAPAGVQATGAEQGVVARVNGHEISARQLKQSVEALVATQPDAKLSPETMKKVKANLLNDLIAQELLYQAGTKLTVPDLDGQVQAKIKEIASRFSSPAQFAKTLRDKGMTDEDLVRETRRNLVANRFVDQTLRPTVQVTDDECRKVYQQNLDKFSQPEMVRISQILIHTEPSMTAQQKKQAREKAEEIRKALLGGAPFVELAKKFSDAPSGKLGGDLGYLGRKELPGALAEAAFVLKPGELSPVVESRAGYDVLKLRDRRPAVSKPYEKAKPEIEEYLRQVKLDGAVQQYLNSAREKAKIEVLLK